MYLGLRKKLIDLAHVKGSRIYCQTLCDEFEIRLDMRKKKDREAMVSILNEISIDEHDEGRPLLASLVLIKGRKRPGDSFFKLCEQLGLGKWDELKQDPAFADEARAHCYHFWSDMNNYRSFR